MIVPYHNEVRKYYDASLINLFLTKKNTTYNEALLTKRDYSHKWNIIVELYTKKGYARDISNASHLQTNTLIIGFNGTKEGIILNISFLPKYIAFYFYHENIHSETPIMDRFGNYNYNLSFFPFSLKQEDFVRDLLENLSVHFEEFSLFNNLYASDTIENVITDSTIREVYSLFHVIFEDNMYSVF